MKIVIAQMEHETNTFSPVETPWDSFGPDGPYIGAQAYRAMKGTKTPIGAFIDVAEKVNAEIITPVAGFAYPSGPVSGAAYDQFCDLIIDGVKQGCDLIMLDLHGAMVVKNRTLDGEGTLLKKFVMLLQAFLSLFLWTYMRTSQRRWSTIRTLSLVTKHILILTCMRQAL